MTVTVSASNLSNCTDVFCLNVHLHVLYCKSVVLLRLNFPVVSCILLLWMYTGYIYAFSRRFYPKRLTVHSDYTFFCQYVCSLGIEPTTFALVTQCSTTEPQEG